MKGSDWERWQFSDQWSPMTGQHRVQWFHTSKSGRWLFACQNGGHRNPGSQNPEALSARNFDGELSLSKEHSTSAALEKRSASEL
jgi:hypothetical protein